MQEDKFKILNYAMHYGVALGFFWAFKYLFHIGATYYSSLDYIYQSLSIGTVFMMYYLTTRFRDKVNNGHISYWQSVWFSVLLCFFASLIEAIVSYFHYSVIDPSYISSINKELLNRMAELDFSQEFLEEAEKASFGPVYYTVSQIFANSLVGLILSLLYGFFVSKKINFNN